MRGHVRPAKDKNGKVIKGAWDTVVDLGKDPVTGKRRQKWKRIYGTRAEADRYVMDQIKALQDGTYVEDTKITLGEYALAWLDGKDGKRYRTKEFYRMHTENHIIPQLGHYRLRAITPKVLREFYADRRRRGKLDSKGKPTGEPLAETTVYGIHRVMNMILESARKERLITHNPLDDLSDPPQRPAPGATAKPLTFEQAMKLLETAKAEGSRYYALYFAALTTGMRFSELAGWRWIDTDLDAGRAQVIETVEKTGPSPQMGLTKSNAGRPVLLVPQLVDVLREWKEQQEEEKRLLGDQYLDFGLIFTTTVGTPLHKQNLRIRDFKPLLKRAGLPPVRFQDLRHSTATILLKWGVHPKIVQEILGHANISMTQDTYSHAMPTMQEGVIEKWGEAFNAWQKEKAEDEEVG